MLVAIAPDGFTRSIRWARSHEGTFLCPECKEPVYIKVGRIVTSHFAHYAGSACTYGEGESERHVRMKQAIADLFGDAEMEVPFLPDRRADVVVTRASGGRFVVECQASPIAAEEVYERTVDYSTLGYPVMWVWDSGLVPEILTKGLNGIRRSRPVIDAEYRVPYAMHAVHDMAGHRAYVLDHADRLLTARFGDAKKRQGFYIESADLFIEDYTPVSVRHVEFQFADLANLEVREVDTDCGAALVVTGMELWKFDGNNSPREVHA